MQIDFTKMDGIGNDFIIIDARKEQLPVISSAEIQKWSDRNNPITKGFDQMAILRESDKADCLMEIYNADGCEVAACGNITRCVSALILGNKGELVIETAAGLLPTKIIDKNRVQVDMGLPKIKWQEIPLKHEVDTLNLEIGQGDLQNPVAVSMGNPHAVFFVDDVDEIDFLADNLGANLEHHELFPAQANIGAAQILDDGNIKLRVFERGTGETLACGTGACAAFVAARRRGLLVGKNSVLKLRGGELLIHEADNGHIFMEGAVNIQFSGVL